MTYNDIKEFWLMIGNAIDKQIPKQVITDDNYNEIQYCPTCYKLSNDTLRSDAKDQYCRFCGQKLKYKKTCFDCKHHFMSDCYLECNIHNRINNDSICDDFVDKN